MRLPFFDPRRDEVAATATDLITRFGLHAHHEASYLAELSAQMHSRWHRVLYGQVAREIDASFVEAQMRLGLRQSAYAKDTKTAAGERLPREAKERATKARMDTPRHNQHGRGALCSTSQNKGWPRKTPIAAV